MIWSKEKKQQREKTKIEKRIESLPTAELVPWADQSLYTIGRYLATWQRTNEAAYLEEARIAADVVSAIVNSLAQRNKIG